MMVIDNKYDIGDTVYLITDDTQSERLITGLYIRQGYISYVLSCGINESWHNDFEITSDKNVLIL